MLVAKASRKQRIGFGQVIGKHNTGDHRIRWIGVELPGKFQNVRQPRAILRVDDEQLQSLACRRCDLPIVQPQATFPAIKPNSRANGLRRVVEFDAIVIDGRRRRLQPERLVGKQRALPYFDPVRVLRMKIHDRNLLPVDGTQRVHGEVGQGHLVCLLAHADFIEESLRRQQSIMAEHQAIRFQRQLVIIRSTPLPCRGIPKRPGLQQAGGDELTEPGLGAVNSWKRFGKRLAQFEELLRRQQRSIQCGKEVEVPTGDRYPTLCSATGHVRTR